MAFLTEATDYIINSLAMENPIVHDATVCSHHFGQVQEFPLEFGISYCRIIGGREWFYDSRSGLPSSDPEIIRQIALNRGWVVPGSQPTPHAPPGYQVETSLDANGNLVETENMPMEER